ncbi:ComEA family DNA-binding protein [Eupransor demetentiae]|uniref:DNA uptake protein ComE or related DNA-binding protein (ComEA) n=1 Tax=Eupransor demetentiae TaxID=3109584 RepID=A0ABM9N3C1_9LACO|nr:DNA uptake protein ComE or related DNA-binding protein (ComEA) [Lactobacillaceae bacterium LMG 33000]
MRIEYQDLLDFIKKYKLYVAAGGVVLLLLGFFTWRTLSASQSKAVVTDTALSSSSASSSSVKSSSKSLAVDLKGAVNKPGLYHCQEGERVSDLVKQAGGFTVEVDERAVNLAQKLVDGQVIVVPKQGEATSANTGINASSSVEKKVVNINTASLEELQALDGVGAKKAEKIIAYRQSKNGFKKIDDIKAVEGIGDKRFEKLKEQITV